ncbi:salicylate hydroxylase protein [Rutstroemia sp. NJR-2017a WRK4]|nr:salicylate hydroxylase protein [Rutstroemia sp. NJR-2017a WRK4]
MATSSSEVAIIGSGLSGLALALSLHHNKIPCRVYESRPAPLNIGGAIMLSPNALRILNTLGVYERIRSKGYNFDILEFKDTTGKLLEVQEFGGEAKYGFRGLRIYRHIVIDALVELLKERNIPVYYGKKYSHIVSEGEKIVWEFTDGERAEADLLVGADGIHSSVRKYIYPDIEPVFTGMAGIAAAVPSSQLRLPEGELPTPVTILSPKGAFILAPQAHDASEVLIAKQFRSEAKDREGWKTFADDEEATVKFLQSNNELFPEIVQNAVSKIDFKTINVWPFYVVPQLEKWHSEGCRVVILGDAAHAIPPSAGQGVNQAFEDVYALGLLLGGMGKEMRMEEALRKWEGYRQKRVERVLALTKQVDLRRVPESRGEQTLEPLEVGWLYNVDIEEDVRGWIEG